MTKTIPQLRVFDYQKAIDFYIGSLHFKLEREYKPDGGRFSLRVSLGDVILELVQHPDEGGLGSWLIIEEFKGLVPYRDSLAAGDAFPKPVLRKVPQMSNTLSFAVMDPFFNRIEFREVMR